MNDIANHSEHKIDEKKNPDIISKACKLMSDMLTQWQILDIWKAKQSQKNLCKQCTSIIFSLSKSSISLVRFDLLFAVFPLMSNTCT